MNVDVLHNNEIEEELINWLKKFEDSVDVLNNIEQLFSKLDSQVIENASIDESVVINGPVHIGKGTVIQPHVTIEGPVIIGENVTISSHAVIRNNAFIGSNCVVGHAADIKRSLCLNKSKIQDLTFVGDSVLGVGARIGSGTIIANRKFDQSLIHYTKNKQKVNSTRDFFGAIVGTYSRIGANCTLMPGTTIGMHTWVLPGCILSGEYESDIMISPPKQELKIRKKPRIELKS